MSDPEPRHDPDDDGATPGSPPPGRWSTLRILLTILLGIPLILIVLALLVLGACFLTLGR